MQPSPGISWGKFQCNHHQLLASLLCLPPLLLPSRWVHASSDSCPTCRPCLSVSFWSPAVNSSQQCLITEVGLWENKIKLELMLRPPRCGRDTLLLQLAFIFQTVSLCYLLVALPSSDSTVMGTQPRFNEAGTAFYFVLCCMSQL